MRTADSRPFIRKAARGKRVGICLLAALAGGLVAVGCGSGTPITNPPPPPPPNNTLPIEVTLGPTGSYVNGVFASVTICAPGTAQCDTIPDVLVDTGSIGLRILASATTLNYPQINDSVGNPLAECLQFQDSFVWGPVVSADVIMAGEKADSVPVQIIGSGAINGNANFPAPPSACTSSGLPSNDSVKTLGANGVLGIGVFRHDCGSACAPGSSSVPALYFSCPSSGCTTSAVDLTNQVQNPVWLLPQDNNGVVVTLPSISPQGAVTVSGSIRFGIGTQSDNVLGQAKIFNTDSSGNIQTQFNSKQYTSFIDSGSNGIYFLDSPTTGLPLCSTNKGFYCPSPAANLSATNIGTATGQSGPVSFTIDDAETLLSNPNFAAFNDLGGPNPNAFDWGLPFFYGRSVFFAINTLSTPAGPGPYFAY